MNSVATEQDCFEFLERIGVDFDLVEHAAVYTIEEVEAEPALEGRNEIKNLFIQDDKGKRFYLVVMPGKKRLDLKRLSADLDEKKVRFCSAEKVQNMLGVSPGSVSIFCLLNDSAGAVKLILDQDLLAEKELGFHPIVNTATVFIESDDLKKITEHLENSSDIIEL